MDFIDKQVAPPKSWEKFEDLTRALFAAIWECPLTQKNGRSGQSQSGVDVYGAPEREQGKTFGVQCKGKSNGYGTKATIAEFDAELAKAERFKPMLGHWTFATTAPNDGVLQEHVRLVSERRLKDGLFPVQVVGWETIQALLSGKPKVVEEFYPEHASDLSKILAMLRAQAVQPQFAFSKAELPQWSEVRFETTRDIGPALMGRQLGPADVSACPILPEVAALVADLKHAGSARLVGVPGAGKSICTLQVAHYLYKQGWRILRLIDPLEGIPPLYESQTPTLYIVDDAHLARPAQLREFEERATASCWILSAHTMVADKDALPGAIQLDAKRAVQVIADGLLRSRDATLSAVRRVDDRIGDRPFDESLEQRIDQAAQYAHFPWQFCFVLGGGWRRASVLASSARAASADLVLATIAIRQLATRDARCSRESLDQLIAGVFEEGDVDAAIKFLVKNRLVISSSDLRCPHQRFASVLLGEVLEGQSDEGRLNVSSVLEMVLRDETMPLGGLSVLLNELSDTGGFRRWVRLVKQEWLLPALKRCWAATEALGIRDSCWFLVSVDRYAPLLMLELDRYDDVFVKWIEAAPEGACYALGRVVNEVNNADEARGKALAARINPLAIAQAMSAGSPRHAGEIADLISMLRVRNDETWRAFYLEHVDREACRDMVSTWPLDVELWIAADFCAHFAYFDQEFGFELIEALVPAIAGRLRDEPQEAFKGLNDIVWNALRLYDPLNIYVGKKAPTQRMKQVGRQICACWSPSELGEKLSRSTHRTFQSAAGLLSFMHKAAPKQFRATVLALSWDDIDRSIGDEWIEGIGDARMLLGVTYRVREARLAIAALVQRNESRIVTMEPHLAALAPASAFNHVAAGKRIAICRWGHVEWRFGALILIRFAQSRPALVPALLDGCYGDLAAALSQQSPSFYCDGLLFLKVLTQIEADGAGRILDRIDVQKAEVGWRNALRGLQSNGEPGGKAQARQVVALLIHYAIRRDDAIGELARQLQRHFPRQSFPLKATMESIDIVKVITE